jgi:hypothetical protein
MGSRLMDCKVIKFPGARVIGKSVRVCEPCGIEDRTVNDLRDEMQQGGHYDFLFAQPGRFAAARDTVGWQGDYKPGQGYYTYLAGVLFQPGAAVPEGYEYRDIAPCKMAVAQIQGFEGEEGGDLFATASEKLAQARDAQGYRYDGAHGMFEMEYYADECCHGEPFVLDFYSPCKKRLHFLKK